MAELSTSTLSGLFGDDSLAFITSKFSLADALLRLVTRDCKFGEFTREALLLIMRVVKAEAGSILEVNRSASNLFFRAVVGQSSDRVLNFVIPLGQGIVGHVAESRQALVVANVEESKIHLRAIGDAVGFETKNLVAVPIIVRGQVYGVLELLNRVGENNFTTSDLELLNYYCEVFAKAIEARLMIAWQRNQGGDASGSGSSGQGSGSEAA
jgi:GAF domain-containing protein